MHNRRQAVVERHRTDRRADREISYIMVPPLFYISTCSRKVTTLSSSEAEHMAQSNAERPVKKLRQVCQELK